MEMEFPLVGLILHSRNFQFIFIICPFADAKCGAPVILWKSNQVPAR